jgi:gliding motility-associated-like protein
MTLPIKRIIILFELFCLPAQVVFSQAYSSKDNYTGTWETPSSWNPTWTVPQTRSLNGFNITINGYITVNGSLSFSGTASNLIINDTLVIKGNLLLDNNTTITINDNGILILMGSLTINNQSIIMANGYLIVTGDINKNSSLIQGPFTSNDNPVKVFVGGTISPVELTDNYPNFPVLNCTTPITTPYPNSTCSYGDMTDIKNDPINTFFQYTCKTANVKSNSSVCVGTTINLTSSGGAGYSYSWSGPNGFTSNLQNPNITNAAPAMAGAYTITVIAAPGCLDTDTINLTVNALPAIPTITAGSPITFCAGGNVTLTSSAGSTYLWSNGATAQSINVTASGSYTVRVTDASGCLSAASAATVVKVNVLPITPTITAGGPTAFCDGGSVTLTSSAGSTYLWSNGATAQNIDVIVSGSYTVRVTDANGCLSAASVANIVTVNALPVSTISADGPTTFCDGGSVTLTSSTGTSYLWSTGATTANINITTSGSYTVRVTDANGCQSAASTATMVNVNALPAVNAGKDTTISTGTSTPVNATVTGTGPFTYSWSPSLQLADAFIEDPTTVSLTTTTIFTLTATSTTTSCSNTDGVTITISGGALSSTPTATPEIVCAGTNVQLNAMASGSSGIYTYAWTSEPAGFTSSVADPIVNPLVNTTYYVAVNDGFTIFSSQVVVTVNTLPATPTITADGPTTFCTKGSVTLSSSAGSNSLWSNGANTATINVTTAGSYTVKVKNASVCLSAASTATVVTVNALPVIPTITAGGPTAFCAGGSVTLTSSAGTSYLWSNSATTATGPSINVTTAGSYTVQVTNASGCQSEPSVATIVTVNALPSASITITDNSGLANNDGIICNGSTAMLTASGGTFYSWSSGETTAAISKGIAGTYAVTVTNSNGCTDTKAANITVNAVPIVAAGSNSPICVGEDKKINLTASAGTGYIYSWSGPNSFTSNNQNPSIHFVTTAMAGAYTVTVTATNGCKAKNTTSVMVNPLPIVTVRSNSPVCVGNTINLTSSDGTGYSYSWSGPNGYTSNKQNPSILNADTSMAGAYKVTVTALTSCSVTKKTIVKVNTVPIASITITDNSGIANNDGIICYGANATLTASGGTSYSWSSGEKTAAITKGTAGTYTVTVTNANGCTDTEAAAITVNPLPVAAITITDNSEIENNDGIICNGATATLTASGGTSYIWSSGETTAAITKGTAGTYNVTVTNANGCTNTATATVVVNASPVANASNNGPVFSLKALNLIGGPEGMTTYSWTGPGGFTSNSQSPTVSTGALAGMAGVYTLTVTNASGCTNTANTTVEVNELPVPSVITPNGDGKNDYFVIGEIIDQVELIIFNRWGNEEYSNRNYSNDWDGRNNKGAELPNDTYFYILKFESGKIKRGSVLIKR